MIIGMEDKAMQNIQSVQDFFKRFPTDDACLEHLMDVRYGLTLDCPKCGKKTTYHRINGIPAFGCQCGHHIHPMAGTPFTDSHTPLQKWFYAMYLFTTSRHGVPAKEIQRQISVTYKTAWRMAHEIRKYMGKVDGNTKLQGHVEADETLMGAPKPGKRGRGAAGKTIIFGMIQRGGDLMTEVVPNVKRSTLLPIIKENIKKGSTVSTDEFTSYDSLAHEGFKHGVCNHGAKQYANGIYSTNSVEGFWSHFKRSVKGTHVHISPKHLPKYLGEFEFRYNLRSTPSLMFSRLLKAF
jgi:transposase-like protein